MYHFLMTTRIYLGGYECRGWVTNDAPEYREPATLASKPFYVVTDDIMERDFPDAPLAAAEIALTQWVLTPRAYFAVPIQKR